MTLIKLTYLQQAVEFAETAEGITKKKTTASTSLNFRSLPIIKVKAAENPKEKIKEAVLIIEEEPVYQKEESVTKKIVEPVPEVAAPTPAFGSLHKIRERLTAQKENSIGAKNLTSESVDEAWQKFIEKLEERKNHSAVTNFKACELNIIDNNCIEIVVDTAFQQKFIEKERSELIEHLQSTFHNKLLVYQVRIEEKEKTDTLEEKPLNRKQLYQKLIEKYPKVKELKDKLKLDLG